MQVPRQSSSNSYKTLERSVMKARNAEIRSGDFNDHLLDIECIDFS